ncbi:MAG: hypothetical protein AAF550_07765, partial [Myxococcota bacterium]
ESLLSPWSNVVLRRERLNAKTSSGMMLTVLLVSFLPESDAQKLMDTSLPSFLILVPNAG